MPFGTKKDENAERYAHAAAWRQAGHTIYVQNMAGSPRASGGPWEQASLEIEAIESAGWRLSYMAQMYGHNYGTTTCVFRLAA